MYEFRKDFVEVGGDNGADTVGSFRGIGNDFIIEKYQEFLEKIIRNENDPRGYHGEYTEEWKCPECSETAERDNKTIVCESCGER